MPQESWKIRAEDIRLEDDFATFIIFCEDEVSEPAYLRSFTVPGKVMVNAVENQDKHWRNLNKAIADCIKNDLLEPHQGSYRIKAGTTTNIWSAYDRDMENEVVDNLVVTNDTTFSTAIQTSTHIGIKVAWSNDAFELWILLHFEAVPVGARLHRDYVYARLTEILRILPDQTAEMLHITSRHNFDYRAYFKKRTNFVLHILPLLTPERRAIAIANAAALEAQYDENTLFHDRNPCTRVHHLVNDLLSHSK